MSVAYIIGNGVSRKDFDLTLLRGSGTIFGCNALYREFFPDYLVAIDPGIIDEITASKFPKERFIVPPKDEQWEPASCNPMRPRSNAGMNAMMEAIKRNAKTLVCLGFDFLLDEPSATSNIFDGTMNYGVETRASENDNKGRMRFLQWLIDRNPDVDFIFVYDRKNLTIRPLHGNNIYITHFQTLLENIYIHTEEDTYAENTNGQDNNSREEV